MKQDRLLLAILICSTFSCSLYGQTKKAFIGLETGIDFMFCGAFEKNYIRGYASPSYSADWEVRNITSQMYRTYAGVKTELIFLGDKFGVLSGFRFSQINSSVTKSNSHDFFYFLLQENGTTTEYLRVRAIHQASTYAGIPIELRYFPFGAHRFSIFFKLGAEFNFLLKTKTDVTFYNADMELYQNSVIAKVGDPNSFYSNLHAGAGIRVGKSSNTRISLDLHLPSVFLTSNTSSVAVANFSSGIQFNIQIPF